jgi:hypothetical protein
MKLYRIAPIAMNITTVKYGGNWYISWKGTARSVPIRIRGAGRVRFGGIIGFRRLMA